MPWCYHFISSGELDYETVTEGDVADLELQELIQQVESTSSEILTYPYVNYSSENCLAFLRAFHVCILIKIRENKYIDSKVLCVKRSEFTDRLVACGYTGPVSIQRKEEIVR